MRTNPKGRWMTDRQILRVLAAAAAVAVVSLLAGCVSIPAEGPATQGLSIAANASGTGFEVNPVGPGRGDTPAAILKGFIAAFQSSTGGYAVAREFLSTTFAGKWDPSQIVQVRTGNARYTPVDGNTIDYSFTTNAIVDSTGTYKPSNSPSTLEFSFTKQNGQWRISEAPNGIVLPDATFQRLFNKQALYFLDQGLQNLVPDLRWFPSGSAATRIVSALLAGPPAWLEGAARSEFPDGTQLTTAGSLVPVVGGVAKVDLTREAKTATPREQQYMLLQLSESLRRLSSVSSVAITVEGAPLVIEDLGANGPEVDPLVDSQALVYRSSDFGFYANDKVASLPQLSSKIPPLVPTSATLSTDGSAVAVRGGGGVSVVRRSAQAPLLLDSRPGLIAPTMDENGFIWTVPADDPNAIRAFDPTGAAHPVTTSLPVDAQVMSLQISRDGARVALLLSSSTGPRLVIAAILRDSKFVPTGLGPLVVDVPLESGDATEVTWVNELTVATLVGVGAQSAVDEFEIGGQHVQLGVLLAGSKSIIGGNGQQGLRVVGDDGVVYTYQGSTWQSARVTVSFIATQR